MNLILGIVTNPDNYLKRTFETVATLDIRLKHDVDVIEPKIKLRKIEGVDFLNLSYAHIPELNRYYFISNVELVHNEIYELTLKCDVLNTYNQLIKDAEASYFRNIKQGDYIKSSLDISELKTVTSNKSDATLGNESTLILTTIGGRK